MHSQRLSQSYIINRITTQTAEKSHLEEKYGVPAKRYMRAQHQRYDTSSHKKGTTLNASEKRQRAQHMSYEETSTKPNNNSNSATVFKKFMLEKNFVNTQKKTTEVPAHRIDRRKESSYRYT